MQALIMTAYKNAEGTKTALSGLSSFFRCFVHADLAGEFKEKDIEALNAIPGVWACRQYRVNWGSIRHLEALLMLMREALKDPSITHLHLVSAEDFPVASKDRFEALAGDDHLYMQMIHTRDYPELSHRYEHFHFMTLLNYRDQSEAAQNWVGRIDRWQDSLGIHRRYVPENKGLVWCTLPRDAAEFAADSQASRELQKKLRFTYIPEEFFFQNLYAGTPFESRIIPDCRRFSVWDQPDRGLPAVLEPADLARAGEQDLFARKIVPGSPAFSLLQARWEGRA